MKYQPSPDGAVRINDKAAFYGAGIHEFVPSDESRRIGMSIDTVYAEASIDTVHTEAANDTVYAEAAIGEYVVSHPATDLEKATRAAREFMVSLGVDLDAEALHRTPYRMAKAYAELMTPAPFTLTTFENDGRYQELLLVRSIPFTSICEHHLLPFVGTADVGYLAGGRIAGLSKLARAVQHMARRPHVQERLTEEIASWLHDRLDARGVGVFMRAEHTCMTWRGVAAVGTQTISQAYTGHLHESPEERNAFRALCLSNT